MIGTDALIPVYPVNSQLVFMNASPGIWSGFEFATNLFRKR